MIDGICICDCSPHLTLDRMSPIIGTVMPEAKPFPGTGLLLGHGGALACLLQVPFRSPHASRLTHPSSCHPCSTASCLNTSPPASHPSAFIGWKLIRFFLAVFLSLFSCSVTTWTCLVDSPNGPHLRSKSISILDSGLLNLVHAL